MLVQEFDKVKIQDGRIGIVYAVCEKEKSALIVLNERTSEEKYPLVADGLFDGAVDVPLSDIVDVI